MGTAGATVLSAKSSWTRASSVALVVAVVAASLAGVGRSSPSVGIRLHADDDGWVAAEGTTSLRRASARTPAVDERSSLTDDASLRRRGVSRPQSTVPTSPRTHVKC